MTAHEKMEIEMRLAALERHLRSPSAKGWIDRIRRMVRTDGGVGLISKEVIRPMIIERIKDWEDYIAEYPHHYPPA